MKNLTKTMTAELAPIPREKLGAKIRRTITGVAFIAGAIAVAIYLDGVPWWVPVALFGLGMHVVSGDLVRVAWKGIVAAAKDVLELVRGKNNPAG